MDEEGIKSFCTALFEPIKEQFEKLSVKFNNDLINLSQTLDKKLQDIFTNFQCQINSELELRDNKLITFQKEIRSLENKIVTTGAELTAVKKELATLKNGSQNSVQQIPTDANLFKTKPIPFSNDENSIKTKLDLAIVGDSIVKYLKLELMNPGKENKLFCFPGANILKIRNELVDINSKYDINKLVLHVSSNCIPQDNPLVIFTKFKILLRDIKTYMPNTTVFIIIIIIYFILHRSKSTTRNNVINNINTS